MPEWVERIFFFVEPSTVWVLLAFVGLVIVFDWVLEFRRLVRGRGPSGCFPVTLLMFVTMLFSKQPLLVDVEAHYVLLMAIKVAEVAMLFLACLLLDTFMPLAAYSMLRRWGLVSRGDDTTNHP